MFFNKENSDLQKNKIFENFNKKKLSKKRKYTSDFYDQEVIKDFIRFTDIININTFGSQPIVMFKKINRIQSPNEKTNKIYSKEKKNSATSREKNQKKNEKNNNNYINKGDLGQKINKSKNKSTNHHSQSPSKKINKNITSKTNRDKEKNSKRVNTQQAKIKTKEYIPKTAKENYCNYQQIFKKEKNGHKFNNNLKSKVKKVDNNENKNKYLTDKNTIQENEKSKNENINNLIKNAVANFKKEYLAKKIKNEQDKKVEKNTIQENEK